MKYCFVAILVILLGSCYTNKNNDIYFEDVKYISKFEDTLCLAGELIDISNLGATTIDVVDTFLVFVGGSLDTFYNVCSKNTYRNLGNFVPKGRGDNELSVVGFPIYTSINDNFSVVYLHDRGSSCVKKLNLTKSVAQQQTIFDEDRVNIQKIPSFKFLYPISDSIFFVHGWNRYLRNDYYALFYKESKNVVILDTVYNSCLQDPGDMFLFNSFGCFHPQKKKYATAMQFFDQINIYSIDNDFEKPFALCVGKQRFSLRDVEKLAMPEKMEYYEDMVCTDSLLFALYANKTRKDWALQEHLPVTIHIFDWQGNAICLLRIKEKLAKLAIDEENGLLYGMTLGEKVYKYVLPKL